MTYGFYLRQLWEVIILFHIVKIYEVINWRANQVPAAAVILVPRVCMMIDAVKKSVVYF